MFRFLTSRHGRCDSLDHSKLYDQDSFYSALHSDLRNAQSRVVIESPFITTKRVRELLPELQRLAKRHVKIVINTKPLEEHDPAYRQQVRQAIGQLQQMGVIVLFTGGHHRKLVIIDDAILYEGSLNVLSQNDSCEVMRRITSERLVAQMQQFLRLEKYIN